MRVGNLAKAVAVLLLVAGCAAVRIEKGWVTLEAVTGETSERFKVDIQSQLKQELNLTQSSRVNIEAKLTFSTDDFHPEFVSFRLRHPTYDNLTEPVLALWDVQDEVFKAVLDLGDPKQIKHMSGDYKLEAIISDDRLEKQYRKNIAPVKVNFRFSLEQPLPCELAYAVPSLIHTEAPPQRQDPPFLFTAFAVVLISVLFTAFLAGLGYQKVNLNLLPSEGSGLLLNGIFLAALGGVLFMLFKFWVSWTFIETMQYFLLAILPLSLAANYAFVHIRKD